ncbi:hypothetical protein [Thiomonas sp. FB-6]|uniref:hypothetical protein n=1 Tax=Thiomonas sp. FB-6 TaxID=1158291 RepID=UPI0003621802|nr:hypothetical protein [Thiomonas sp. FB-6]
MLQRTCAHCSKTFLVRPQLPHQAFDTHLHWRMSVHADPAHRWLRGVVHASLVYASPA